MPTNSHSCPHYAADLMSKPDYMCQECGSLRVWVPGDVPHVPLRFDWLHPCEAVFERLACEAPRTLIDWMQRPMLPTDLTFAAEALGRVAIPAEGLTLLICLLKHPKAYVREGALYGLVRHTYNDDVCEALKRVDDEDDNADLRELARSILAARGA